MFKYGDKILINSDNEHDGFYEGVEGIIVAQMLEENKPILIGQKKPMTYSILLPKKGDKDRFIEVKEEYLQKI